MGIFSFLKNAGAKLFTKKTEEKKVDPEAERQTMIAALKKAIADNHIEVKDLFVDVQDDKVIVHGEVDKQEDKEKVVLILGNVEGIASVDDQLTVANPKPEAKFYEVKKGDTLSKIAKEFYGNAMKYPVIFEANKPMLKNPDLIYPGQMLRIPPLEN